MKNHKLLIALPLLLTISSFSLAGSEESVNNISLAESSNSSDNTILPLQCSPFPECNDDSDQIELINTIIIIQEQTSKEGQNKE